MNVYKIQSQATIASDGWPDGIRTIYSRRRSPDAVARHETTAAERAVHVCVTQLTGRGKGLFFAGTPTLHFRRP